MLRIKPLLALIFLCATTLSGAQEALPSPNQNLEAPINLVSGYMVATFQERTLGTISLVIDTGSAKSLLFSDSLDNAEIQRVRQSKETFRGTGAGKSVRSKGKLQLDLITTSQTFLTMSVEVIDRTDIGQKLLPGANGVLGWDVLSRYCTRINPEKRQILISPPENTCLPIGSENAAFRGGWQSDGITLPVEVRPPNGKPMHTKLRLDTGFDAAILLQKRPRELEATQPPQKESAGIGLGINGSYKFQTISPATVIFDGGTPEVSGVSIFIQLDPTHSPRSAVDGVMGNMFWTKMVITLAPSSHTVFLEPTGNAETKNP